MYGSSMFYSPPPPATDFNDNKPNGYPKHFPYTNSLSPFSNHPYQASKLRSRTLSLKMGSVMFPITCETLTQLFSKFGIIESIKFIRQWPSLDATIQFQFVENAVAAKSSMEHRYLYEVGGMFDIDYVAVDSLCSALEQPDQYSPFLEVSIGFAWYPITPEMVRGVFDHYGVVQIIHMRQVGDGFEATLHYQSIQSAVAARNALHGRNIHYTGGRMDIQFGKQSQLSREQMFERIEQALTKLESRWKWLTPIPDRAGYVESIPSTILVDSITDIPTQFQGISHVEPIMDDISCIPSIKVVNYDCETENMVCDIASLFNECENSDFGKIGGDRVYAHDMLDELSVRIVSDDCDEDQVVANVDEHLTDHKCSNDDKPHFNSEVRIANSLVNFDGQLVLKSSPSMLKSEAKKVQVDMIYEHKDKTLHPDELLAELAENGDTYRIIADQVLYDKYGCHTPATLPSLATKNIEETGSEILPLPPEMQSLQTHLAQSRKHNEFLNSERSTNIYGIGIYILPLDSLNPSAAEWFISLLSTFSFTCSSSHIQTKPIISQLELLHPP